MKGDIKTAVEFINRNFSKLKFYPNQFNFVVFKDVKDGDYSLEMSRFGVDSNYGFQLCSISDRKDKTTLFFNLSDIIECDQRLGSMIESMIKVAKNELECKKSSSNFDIVKSRYELSIYDLDCNQSKGLTLISTYVNAEKMYCYIFKKN